MTVARTWMFEAGSVIVADRAYLDFTWSHQLQARGVTFVTRIQRVVRYRVTHQHNVRAGTGILSFQTIELTSARNSKAYPDRLRRVVYRDPRTTNRYVFVTRQHLVGCQDDRRPLQVPVADSRCIFKWFKQSSESETLRGPVEARDLDATVGGRLHVRC